MGVASIVGIVNQKGGTGKTTSCVNLGVDLAHEGKRVLLVDCDPQASLTISLGHPQPDALSVTLADLLAKALNSEPVNPGEGILHHEEGGGSASFQYCIGGNGGLAGQCHEPGDHTEACAGELWKGLRSHPAGL